jgi:Putative beta barrel porin-7 (BBP7)
MKPKSIAFGSLLLLATFSGRPAFAQMPMYYGTAGYMMPYGPTNGYPGNVGYSAPAPTLPPGGPSIPFQALYVPPPPTSLVLAQSAPAPEPVGPTPSAAIAAPQHDAGVAIRNDEYGNDPVFSFRSDYMLWWVRSSPLPVPLVTTNKDAFGSIGALNEPGTRVIYGAGANDRQDLGSFSGIRASAAVALGPVWSMDVSAFTLDQQSSKFTASSAGGASPIVSIPVNATQPFGFNPAGETSLNAGGTPNTVTVNTSLQLWGVETNNYFVLAKGPSGSVEAILGFRYMNLREGLVLSDSFSDATTGGGLSVNDSFRTENDFYGGQLGLRGVYTYNRLTVAATGKLALGTMEQILDIEGATTVTKGAFGLPTGSTGTGLFAVPSNIGRHTHDAFSVLPEFQLDLSYAVTKHINLIVGYDYLYATEVLRPGDQIDRNVNVTQNMLLSGGGPVTGPLAPLPHFNSSNFWAQGINFGVQLHW